TMTAPSGGTAFLTPSPPWRPCWSPVGGPCPRWGSTLALCSSASYASSIWDGRRAHSCPQRARITVPWDHLPANGPLPRGQRRGLPGALLPCRPGRAVALARPFAVEPSGCREACMVARPGAVRRLAEAKAMPPLRQYLARLLNRQTSPFLPSKGANHCPLGS